MDRSKSPQPLSLRAAADLSAALRRFAVDRHAAAAVEFALVSGMLILSVVFIMILGILLYFNQALDYATNKAARQIMTGVVQKAGMSQTSFRTSVVCPYLPAAMACGDVIVNVQTVTEAAGPAGYYSFVNSSTTALVVPPLSNANAVFTPGVQGSYVYLQVIYPFTMLPSFLVNVFGTGASYNGSPAYLAISTAAFKNEQY